MEPSDLLKKMASALDKLSLPYAIVGSVASASYGEPRLTIDLDVLVDLNEARIAAFCNEFPSPEYYLSQPAVESAVRKEFQFNIIHPSSGLKVDCFVAGRSPFNQAQLQRALAVDERDLGYVVRFASSEDVILKKLEYFQLGESEKHARDICGIVKMQVERLDSEYIHQWACRLGLEPVWNAVLERITQSD